jgi:hypothetical protein
MRDGPHSNTQQTALSGACSHQVQNANDQGCRPTKFRRARLSDEGMRIWTCPPHRRKHCRKPAQAIHVYRPDQWGLKNIRPCGVVPSIRDINIRRENTDTEKLDVDEPSHKCVPKPHSKSQDFPPNAQIKPGIETASLVSSEML